MSKLQPPQFSVLSVSGWLHELFEEVGDGIQEHGIRFIHHRDPRIMTRLDALAGVDVLLAASTVPVTREVLSAATRLRAVVCPFIGTEAFDMAAASELGILVINGQVAENWQSMSEATIMLILASLYDLHESERLLRENLPHPQRDQLSHAARKDRWIDRLWADCPGSG